MSRLLREAGSDPLRPVRRVAAAIAIGVVGRVVTGAAIDAFLMYVFGDPAADHNERPPAEIGWRPGQAALEHRSAA